MSRRAPACWRICPSQVRSRLSCQYVKKWMIVALTALTLTANGNPVDPSPTPSPTTAPSFFIPMGKYLEYFNIGNIYFDNGSVYYKGISNQKVRFESTELIPNPESCWSKGHDLQGNGETLSCDTESQTQPEKASRFFYSALVRYGGYLNTCTGVLQTREKDRTYLYASCLEQPTRYPFINDPWYTPGKLDITDCEGEIINNRGRLQCSNLPVQPKHILTGSYLESCSMSHSVYDPNTQTLQALCPGLGYSNLTLNNAGNCIGNGKDIVLTDGELTCQNVPSKEVKQYTASLYLPAGNYLATCRGMIFYPCMGSNNQGLLAAECANNEGRFDQAMLEDGDDKCRMSNLGYISNTRGKLRCDPDITFDDEDPTQGSGLLPHFQCNQP